MHGVLYAHTLPRHDAATARVARGPGGTSENGWFWLFELRLRANCLRVEDRCFRLELGQLEEDEDEEVLEVLGMAEVYQGPKPCA